eukprot:CAMPEP_0177621180 /NCGR_PEP_ID=MMETSP0419_2-20121207/27421_1 /TAXON_ID=582737 /ORGANISM="Tetraselmis sp., Strain GSL018" /LENGTH=97 /DNA_ID=CAMNT_0019121027 /DNA_START=167 /DNA_END=461 /DNA_ORIENTATION=-
MTRPWKRHPLAEVRQVVCSGGARGGDSRSSFTTGFSPSLRGSAAASQRPEDRVVALDAGGAAPPGARRSERHARGAHVLLQPVDVHPPAEVGGDVRG